MAGENGYTPIQLKMLKVLQDGHPHTAKELHDCCGPSNRIMVKLHIGRMRKRLPIDYDVAYLRRRIEGTDVTYYVLLRYPTEPLPLLAARVYPKPG